MVLEGLDTEAMVDTVDMGVAMIAIRMVAALDMEEVMALVLVDLEGVKINKLIYC